MTVNESGTNGTGRKTNGESGGRDDRETTADGGASRRSVLRSIGVVGAGSAGLSVGTVQASPPSHAQANGRSDGTETGTSRDTVTTAGETSTSETTMQVGMYDGSSSSTLDGGTEIEQWLETGLDVQNLFVPWDDALYEVDELFGQTVPALWQAGRSPMLTWELFLTSGSTPDDILSRVADGQYDRYISEWTSRLNRAAKESGVRNPTLYARLAHETNGNWYPWAPAGGTGSPADYVRMWRHVKEQVESQVSDEVEMEWVWAVNGTDVGEYSMEELYPGDGCVDWVALDAYNWGASQSWSDWRSPEEMFARPIDRLKSLSDSPIAVTEVASSSLTASGHDVDRKSEWISRLFAALHERGVEMCIWFNEDKESDWAVFGGERGREQVVVDGEPRQVYAAFADAVGTYCRSQ